MDLKSTQLKDTYGNLLTIGTTAGSPTTGTLENGDGEDITSLTLAGDITASKNQNATSSFTFQNTDTTGTNVRTHLNATAGNRSVRLEAIHSDYSYLVSNNARLYLQTNSSSNTPVYLDGDNVIFNGQLGIGETNPSVKVHIKDELPIARIQGTGSGEFGLKITDGNATLGGITYNSSTGEQRINGAESYIFQTIYSGGQERLRIDSSGNVGMNATPENSAGTWRNYQLGSLSMAGRANDSAPDAMFGTNFKFTTANAEQRISAHATSRIFFNDDVITFQNAGSSTAGSTISWNERMRILSGGGLTFNGDTATANALDDYEEGTWTATFGGSSNLTSIVEVQNKYTKIGNVVHINISYTADVTSSSAETQIVFALPFATSDSHNDVGLVSVVSGSGADRYGVGATFRATTSTTNVYIIIGANQINATGSATIKTSFTYIIE